MRINAYAPKIVSVVDSTIVDAKQRYGITSSSTADLTSNFQDMADDFATSGSKHVVIPAGEYHITDTISFTSGETIGAWPSAIGMYSGPYISGAGRYATKIYMDTAGKSAFAFSASGTPVQMEYVRLEGMGFYGQGLSNSDTCAIQMGGVSATETDIISRSSLRDILIRHFATGIRMDDCTSVMLEFIKIEGCNYGIEFGFNVDLVSGTQLAFGSPTHPVKTGGTITSGSPIITGIGDTSDLVAGMQVVADEFPQGTLIDSVDSGTQITTDTNATGNGTGFSTVLGTALSYGTWTGAFNATPGSQNAHKFESCWFMRLANTFNCIQSTTASIVFENCYYESNNRIAVTGVNGSVVSPQFIAWDGNHFGGNTNFQSAAIYDDGNGADGSIKMVMRNNRSDANSAYPWVRIRSAKGIIDWYNNILNVSAGDSINIFDSTNGHTPAQNERFCMGMGETINYKINLGVSGALTPNPLGKTSHTIEIGPITGAVTINDVSAGTSNAMAAGQVIRFVLIEDGTAGHAITWNATYKFHTAWTDSTVTTDADKTSVVDFYYDGADFIQISPANAWL